jgi:hypothetical protein
MSSRRGSISRGATHSPICGRERPQAIGLRSEIDAGHPARRGGRNCSVHLSQSSDGARQKVPISEPRHRAGDGGTVVHDGGLVRIQETHEASLEGKSLGNKPRVPSALSIGRRGPAAESCRFPRRQRLPRAAATDCRPLTYSGDTWKKRSRIHAKCWSTIVQFAFWNRKRRRRCRRSSSVVRAARTASGS